MWIIIGSYGAWFNRATIAIGPYATEEQAEEACESQEKPSRWMVVEVFEA
jgi:hypothetical protein